MNLQEKLDHFFDLAGADLGALQNDFFVIGSAALFLSGVKITEVGDVDLLTTLTDAAFLKQKWSHRKPVNYVPEHPGLFRSDFGRFNFDGVEVEVMGNLEVNKGQHWVPLVVHQFETVSIAGLSVKVPTLMEQYRIFKFFGRKKDLDKADLLQKYL